jgi:hypothetical protein
VALELQARKKRVVERPESKPQTESQEQRSRDKSEFLVSSHSVKPDPFAKIGTDLDQVQHCRSTQLSTVNLVTADTRVHASKVSASA